MSCRPIAGSVRRPRTTLLAASAVVAMAALAGCDNPDVQDAVWNGANDLAVALIDALFLAFKPGSSQTTPVTVSWLLDTFSTAIA